MGERARPRILLADEDASVRNSLARALADTGHSAETAADGSSALVALTKRSFALALIDLDLQRMGGPELATVILERWPETALMVASRSADTLAAVGWMQAGAYDYLTKPFDLARVLARIDRALERRRSVMEARRQHRQLEVGVINQARVTKRLFLGAIKSLSSALEAKDNYTKGHSVRVSRAAAEIARALGVSREEMRRIRLAGRLHDIGKIGVREEVLSKPSALTDAEYKHVQTHPLVGERILAPTLIDAETVRMVRHHHERYGGGGYPDGLAGSAIPLGARVLAVADAFDALSSDRPYRSRLSREEALSVLREGAGSQWQPTLVEALAQSVRGV
jgi:response regulator RpfG family c-di-GMP phosphodiesterase